MNNEKLLLRQQQLINRSAQLRESIADQSKILIKPLALADKVRAGVNCVYQNPTLSVSAMLFLFLIKPRKSIVWASRFWRVWKTFKRIQVTIGKTP